MGFADEYRAYVRKELPFHGTAVIPFADILCVSGIRTPGNVLSRDSLVLPVGFLSEAAWNKKDRVPFSPDLMVSGKQQQKNDDKPRGERSVLVYANILKFKVVASTGSSDPPMVSLCLGPALSYVYVHENDEAESASPCWGHIAVVFHLPVPWSERDKSNRFFEITSGFKAGTSLFSLMSEWNIHLNAVEATLPYRRQSTRVKSNLIVPLSCLFHTFPVARGTTRTIPALFFAKGTHPCWYRA